MSPKGQETAAIEAFEYLSEYKLMVCKEHGYALRNLDRHLLEYHVFPLSVRKAVVQHFNGVRRVLPEDARLPTPYGPPINVITPPKSGFLCAEEDCGFISTCRARIGQHCNGHGWKSTSEARQHWTDVWVQSFCTKAGKQRWFPVSVEEAVNAEDEALVPDQVLAQKQMILRDLGELRAKRKIQLEVLEREIVKTDQTGWWKRTDWPTHLSKTNLRHLAHAARLPGKDEPGLKKIAD